jgi:hypothetical protein
MDFPARTRTCSDRGRSGPACTRYAAEAEVRFGAASSFARIFFVSRRLPLAMVGGFDAARALRAGLGDRQRAWTLL